MSRITTIFNSLVTFAGTQLPSHRRLFDPYTVENNPEQFLRMGWGIRVESGLNTDKEVCNDKYYLSRTFTFILARECVAVDSDPSRRETAKLELLEDLDKLITGSRQDDTLSGEAIDFKYANDGGFVEIFVEDKPYTYLAASFTVDYTQTI